ncbi:MAG TPA: GlxA family transcriptional regulator [Rhizobiaceae bacterium]|nr:GlxA family transcriptional regulator [Rhizobiaceae bacterium]
MRKKPVGPKKIALVIHPGFQLMDTAGPTTAFEMAERFQPGSYEQVILAPELGAAGGEVESSSGLKLAAAPLAGNTFDTVIVSGGEIIRSRSAAAEIVGWLKRVKARRVASVCSGAFLLAATGKLDGRRATTHWESTGHFAGLYPKVKLDAERIYIRDGDIWTSAGISAGIDLALALIEDDHGPALARRVAQQLVVHQRRPGGQSQFSAPAALGGRTGRFAELVEWMRAHLAESLTVERLADRAAMSPRNFARAFLAETGTTPAKAVERLRLETARLAVEMGHAPLEGIAEDTGFGDAGRMRRAFMRGFGQPPQALRRAARA